MNVSMLLGFFDPLIQLIANALSFLLKIALNWLLVPLLQIIIVALQYMLSGILYSIGTFVLRLVDFMEIFFRALAGMEGGVNGQSISLSLGGQTGDILIQLILNKEVKQAFLSMVIVGLFLLLVTTVFQIVKVEYTTEGAKNSKTPIIQKAFRSLANLLLLPALVVLGIFFSNSLLGLLDDATAGSANATISGTIFVCAASEAAYEEPLSQAWTSGSSLIDVSVDWLTRGIEKGLTDILPSSNTANDSSKGSYKAVETVSGSSADGDFQTMTKKYYDIQEVSKYYFIPNINYVVMIFGGVVVLKSLFYACFGLINRLYKCALLFIISPVVIGMTPINEGGLGKWRTAFIGQVLAAYGTVMALNLFFIILKPLLSIQITFNGGNWTDGLLTDNFMTMLLKVVVVIAGVLLIENFAKDIGGYFGADDAMASGKDTAGKVGDTVRKGVTTVAAGAVGMAMVAKGGVGLAKKLKESREQRKEERSHSEAGVGRAKYKATMQEMKKQDKEYKKSGDTGSMRSRKQRRDAATRAAENEMAKYREKAGAFRSIQSLDQGIADKTAENEEIKEQIQEAKSRDDFDTVRALAQKYTDNEEAIQKSQEKKDAAVQALGGEGSDTYKDAQGIVEAEDKVERDQTARKNARKEKISAVGMRATSTLMGLAQQGMSNAPGKKWIDFARKAETDGSKLMGDNYEAATAGAAKARDDRLKGVGETLGGKAEAAYTAAGAAILANSIADSMGHKMQQSTREINQEIKNLADVLQNMSTDKREDYFAARFDSLKAKGLNMEYGEFKAHVFEGGKIEGNINQKLELSADKLGMTLDPKDIEKAVAEAMKKGGSTQAIADAVKSVFEKVAKDGNTALLSMLTKVIEEKISQLGSK
ncbi:MAG: hypothetical protein E7356_04305 [Clostridiales bacterium]|nr:hypothetical protein [Clostridiales bacterium]